MGGLGPHGKKKLPSLRNLVKIKGQKIKEGHFPKKNRSHRRKQIGGSKKKRPLSGARSGARNLERVQREKEESPSDEE